jgi:hypothetical protein
MLAVPDGTIISFATAPDSLASDGGVGAKNSPYATALNEVLRRPGLDVLQAFNQVGLSVKRATSDQQRPWISASPIDGQYYLAGAAPVPVPKPTPAPVDPIAVARLVVPPAGTATSLRCPAAGTIAVRNGRDTVKYSGPDPQDPTVCFFEIEKAWNKMVFGLWTSSVNGSAKFAAAVQGVIGKAPGTKSTFDIVTESGGVKRAFSNEVVFEGTERLEIEQVARPVFRITVRQRENGGSKFESDWQLWFDQATGVMLRYRYTAFGRPDPRHPDWMVTQLRVPG